VNIDFAAVGLFLLRWGLRLSGGVLLILAAVQMFIGMAAYLFVRIVNLYLLFPISWESVKRWWNFETENESETTFALLWAIIPMMIGVGLVGLAECCKGASKRPVAKEQTGQWE
jgi:hypothetical protein